MPESTNWYIAWFMVPGGKICFDTFIAISAYFLVDQYFSSTRFFKMYVQVLFYSVLTISVASMLGSSFSWVEWFTSFFPITGSVQGFAQTYLAFYLILPLLSKIAEGITKQQIEALLFVLSLFVFVFRFNSSIAWSEQSVYCRLILFIYIYFIMLYLKKYPFKILNNNFVLIPLFSVCWFVIFGYFLLTKFYPQWPYWNFFNILVLDEGGLLFLFSGIMLFFIFKNMKMNTYKWINYIAGSTLAVLMIHDGHFFRGWTWHLLCASDWYSSSYYFLWILGVMVLIYAVCFVIDIFRKILIEKPLFNHGLVKLICQYFDDLVNGKNKCV